MGISERTVRGRRSWTGFLLAGVVVLGALVSATPAWAHGEGETEEGYLLVQQARGHLAHDTTSTGIDLAMEKVDDALNTKDQEGVDVAEVQQAKAALEGGQAEQARVLLQHSIIEALAALKPAIGEQTGTTLVLSAQPGRGGLTGGDVGFLIVSVLLVFVGVGLAWRFRPQDNVHELRRSLGPPGGLLAPAQHSKDAS